MATQLVSQRVATVHHLSGTGGTMICKCLAAMRSVCMISEINPNTVGSVHFNPFDPVQQFVSQYGADFALSEADRTAIFLDRIGWIQGRLVGSGRTLVLRDHAHSDWLLQRPRGYSSLLHAVSRRYDVRSVVTLRNPVESYLSLTELGWLPHVPSFQDYCARIVQFAGWFLTRSPPVAFFHYEHFVRAPAETVRAMSAALGVPYDPSFFTRYGQIPLTGDSGRGRSAADIQPLPVKAIGAGIRSAALRSAAYRQLCAWFGYPDDPEQLRRDSEGAAAGLTLPAPTARSRPSTLVLSGTAPVAAKSAGSRRLVIAYRIDRLGARLSAVATARRLANQLGAGFAFVWPPNFKWGEEINNHHLVFSERFIADHHMPAQTFYDAVVAGPAEANGELCPVLVQGAPAVVVGNAFLGSAPGLAGHLGVEPGRPPSIEDIGFSERVLAIVDRAGGLGRGRKIGLHMRRGDILDFWLLKHVPRYAPEAFFVEALDRVIGVRPDDTVFIFTDDPARGASLQRKLDHGACRLVSFADWTVHPLEEAVCNFVLMARMDCVLGAMSAFRENAVALGGGSTVNVITALAPTTRLALLRRTLAELPKGDPERIVAAAALAQLSDELGDLQQAVQAADMAHTLRPDSVDFARYVAELSERCRTAAVPSPAPEKPSTARATPTWLTGLWRR